MDQGFLLPFAGGSFDSSFNGEENNSNNAPPVSSMEKGEVYVPSVPSGPHDTKWTSERQGYIHDLILGEGPTLFDRMMARRNSNGRVGETLRGISRSLSTSGSTDPEPQVEVTPPVWCNEPGCSVWCSRASDVVKPFHTHHARPAFWLCAICGHRDLEGNEENIRAHCRKQHGSDQAYGLDSYCLVPHISRRFSSDSVIARAIGRTSTSDLAVPTDESDSWSSDTPVKDERPLEDEDRSFYHARRAMNFDDNPSHESIVAEPHINDSQSQHLPKERTPSQTQIHEADSKTRELDDNSASTAFERQMEHIPHLEIKLSQLKLLVSESSLGEESDSKGDQEHGFHSLLWETSTDERDDATTWDASADDLSGLSIFSGPQSYIKSSAGESSETNAPGSNTLTGQHNIANTGSKRKFGPSSDNEDDKGESSNGKRPQAPPGPSPPENSTTPAMMIPCFVDGCKGKDQFASYLVRCAHKHHSFPYCRRCCKLIEAEDNYERHISIGDTCEHHCISSTCHPKIKTNLGQRREFVGQHRHVRKTDCPPFKTVAVEDLWQYMYHLRYPGRALPRLVCYPGPSHPHGRGRTRSHRKIQPKSRAWRPFEKQLAEAQAAIEAMNEKRSTETELRKHIERLENIIRMIVDTCNLPNFVRRQIVTEAPHVISSTDSVSATPDTGTMLGAGTGQTGSVDAPPLPQEIHRLTDYNEELTAATIEPFQLMSSGATPSEWHWDEIFDETLPVGLSGDGCGVPCGCGKCT